MIYVIGDSHADPYRARLPIVELVHGRFVTMHAFSNNEFDTSYLKENDIILIVFGEVDIRFHLSYQLNLGRDINEIIETLVSQCETKIKSFPKCKIMIRSVVPPLRNTSLLNRSCKHGITASIELRIHGVKLLNERLQEMCKRNGFIFVPSPPWIEKDGEMMDEYSDGEIHIGRDHHQRVYDDFIQQILGLGFEVSSNPQLYFIKV